MQVWNHITQSYETQDKYTGRDVRTDDFSSALAKFFYDGERRLVYHIPVILQKLYALARIINRLKGYRFYGCSLLLIYDGDHETQEAYRGSISENSRPTHRTKRNNSMGRRPANPTPDTSKSKAPMLRRTLSEDLLSGTTAHQPHHSGGRGRKRGEINIRIVDFAHTTTGQDFVPCPAGSVPDAFNNGKGYHADLDPETGLIRALFPPHHPEHPDLGFLFGLKNIASSLERIWGEDRGRRARDIRDGVVGVEPLERLVTPGSEIFDSVFEEDEGLLSS